MAEYTPDEGELLEAWIIAHSEPGWGGPVDIGGQPRGRIAEGKRAPARVRRDAAREALDGLIRDLQEKGRCAADSSLPDVTDMAEILWHAQDEARTYRDTHYPEETQ